MNTITKTPEPTTPVKATLLRGSLLFDAAVTGANGLAYAILAAPLSTLFGASAVLLIAAGGFLLCSSIVFLVVGRASRIPAGGAWFAILVNLAWAIASVVYVLIADWLTPAGQVWGVLQALVVLGFSVCQIVGLRRGRQ